MSDIKMPQRWFRVYDTGWVKDCAGEWVKSEDVEPLLAEIERLRALVHSLRWPLAVYVHAHQTGNSVPPHIEARARAALEAKP